MILKNRALCASDFILIFRHRIFLLSSAALVSSESIVGKNSFIQMFGVWISSCKDEEFLLRDSFIVVFQTIYLLFPIYVLLFVWIAFCCYRIISIQTASIWVNQQNLAFSPSLNRLVRSKHELRSKAWFGVSFCHFYPTTYSTHWLLRCLLFLL